MSVEATPVRVLFTLNIPVKVVQLNEDILLLGKIHVIWSESERNKLTYLSRKVPKRGSYT
jgi:hypothetical protein